MKYSAGHSALIAGREAEQKVADQLLSAGWGAYTSPELDYGRKIDVMAICPEGVETAVQVSINDKSNRAKKALEKRNILPVYTANSVSVAGQICANCVDVVCPVRVQ